MPYNRPKIFEFEKLAKNATKGIDLEQGTPFAYVDLITTFKSCIKSKGSQQALKYSAYMKTKGALGYTFMLGWDHALIIKKIGLAWCVTQIISGSFSSGNKDTWAYEIDHTGTGKHIVSKPPVESKHNNKWATYDFSKSPKQIVRLITFSITSCSFACLFDEDADFLIISHMAFSPPIPLAWLAYDKLGVRTSPSKPLCLLASVNSTPGELTKFTTLPKFPLADRLHINSILVTRGPVGLKVQENEVPFMTHPYTTLDFTPKTIYFGGALGSNNDNTRGFRELPPFHSIFSKHYPTLMASNDAKAIIEAVSELMQGKYGFRELHQLVIKKIVSAHRRNVKFSTSQYKTLVGQTKGGMFSKAKVPIVAKSKENILAIFLLAVLSFKPDAKECKWIRDAVLAAWDEFQLGFRFDMDKLDKW